MRIPAAWRLLAGLVLLLIVAVAMATWLYALRRMEAIRYVRSHGGSIDFADGHDGSRVPDWLRGIQSINGEPGGSDLGNVTVLSDATNLYLTQVRDDDLRSIGRFRQLERLVLVDPQLTGRGLRSVRDCPHLRIVEIERAAHGDELLEALGGLALTKLKLHGVTVTDTGLRHVAPMPLEVLELSDTRLSDSSLRELAGLHRLAKLDLHASNLSGADFAHLESLPLDVLKLDHTDVTDAQLAHLAGMSLIELSLEGTQTTDAALAVLKMLPLGFLDLTETRVTPAGVRQLQGKKGLTLYLTRPPFDEAGEAELRSAGLKPILHEHE